MEEVLRFVAALIPWIFVFWMVVDLVIHDPLAAFLTGAAYVAGIYWIAIIKLMRNR